MEKSEFYTLFEDVFKKNGLEEYVQPVYMEQFCRLTNIMIETNKVMNITALTTPDKIIPLHYADCVKIASVIPQNAKVADIGCGGGFPILPLAIVRPDLQLVGIDSTDKKVKYVNQTAKELNLTNVTAISGRAEDFAKDTQYRETFDIVISRAVARLNVLNELCIPFVRINGAFIAMKGAAGQEEVDESIQGIQKLGGCIESVTEYDLMTVNESESRVLVQISKKNPTPTQYPRAFGAIKKKPL